MAVGMQKVEPAVSISEVIALDDNSEFAQAVNGKSTKTVMGTVEELMETLRAINPRLYESVIRQLTE